jgi:hypothetical protein
MLQAQHRIFVVFLLYSVVQVCGFVVSLSMIEVNMGQGGPIHNPWVF